MNSLWAQVFFFFFSDFSDRSLLDRKRVRMDVRFNVTQFAKIGQGEGCYCCCSAAGVAALGAATQDFQSGKAKRGCGMIIRMGYIGVWHSGLELGFVACLWLMGMGWNRIRRGEDRLDQVTK